jgi:hypothetical protein
MKKRILFFSLLGMLFLASCSVGAGDSDYSPQMTVTSISVNGVSKTTLDTLNVGDVLQLSFVANGVSKPLTSVKVTNESEYSDISFPNISSLDQRVLNLSDLSKGYFGFDVLGVYAFTFTVEYTVKKANKEGATLNFVVNSTSQYSPMTYLMKLSSK